MRVRGLDGGAVDVYIVSGNVGTDSGTVGQVVDRQTGKVLWESPVLPFGYHYSARKLAYNEAEKRGWIEVTPPGGNRYRTVT
jgi:hypothetical protein